MLCPNCNTPCGDQDRYCSCCGYVLHDDRTTKKGSHIVPILILILLAVLGTTVFFATQSKIPSKQQGVSVSSETPWFQVHDGYLYFNETLYTGGSEILIPSEINGQTIRGLSDGCFENCTGITTVILPYTLQEIGSYAFSGCTSLRGIYLPEEVCVIGANAFLDCSALEAITIPAAMNFIGPEAFEGCHKLHHIFYSGFYRDWIQLYNEFIGVKTAVHCLDGSFYHSPPTN